MSRYKDRNELVGIRRQLVSSAFRLLALTVCLALLFGMAPNVSAEGNAAVSVKTEIGYNGALAMGKLNPVKIVVTSADEDISGDLVIQMADPRGDKDINYVKHVDLPKGVSKEVWFALPGTNYNDKNNAIRFYRDSFDKGEAVPIASGTDYLSAFTVNGTRVGVLSEDADSFNFLALLQQQRQNIEVFNLKPDALPKDAANLDALDVIAVNRFASDTITPEQIKAIENWVASGGTLILSGGASFAKTEKAFEALSPVRAQGVTSVTDLSALANDAGKPLALSEPITLSTAEPVEGAETLLEQNGIPLLASKTYGNGRVVYAAYDPALQPLAGWNGHPDVWMKVLQNKLQASNQMGVKYGQDRYWTIQNALQNFPSLHTPGIGGLAIVLVIYALAAAPVLYLVLKRFDRREWAWFLIPGLAVAASVVIYVFGAQDKMKTLGHSLTVIELSGSGQGNRTSGTALFVPEGGDYTLTYGTGAYPKLFPEQMGQGGGLRGETGLNIRLGAEANELEFKGVPFWSIRQTVMKDTQQTEFGAVRGELSINVAGVLEGKVKNETASDLSKVFVYYGGTIVSIGDLKKGESKQVTLSSTGGLRTPFYDVGNMAYPQNGNNPYENERERSLLNYYFADGDKEKFNRPIIFGWSEDQGMAYQVNGKQVENDQLTLWAQPLGVSIVKDKRIQIPTGFIKPEMTSINVSMIHQNGPLGDLIVSDGTIVAEYRLPVIKGAKYAKLQIGAVAGGLQPGVTAEMWNAAAKAWEKADFNASQTFENEKIAPLLEGGRTLKLRLTVGQQEANVRLPDISLEGEVSP